MIDTKVDPMIVSVSYCKIQLKEDAPLSSVIKLINALNLTVENTELPEEMKQIDGIDLNNE